MPDFVDKPNKNRIAISLFIFIVCTDFIDKPNRNRIAVSLFIGQCWRTTPTLSWGERYKSNAIGVAYSLSKCGIWVCEIHIFVHTKYLYPFHRKTTQHRWRCFLVHSVDRVTSLRSATLPCKQRNPGGVYSLRTIRSLPIKFPLRHNAGHFDFQYHHIAQ